MRTSLRMKGSNAEVPTLYIYIYLCLLWLGVGNVRVQVESALAVQRNTLAEVVQSLRIYTQLDEWGGFVNKLGLKTVKDDTGRSFIPRSA